MTNKIRVLVVDDEAAILRFLRPALEANNYEMASSGTVAESTRRIAAEPPDIVVLDLGLPQLDGFEVIRRIRAEAETPILVVTGRKEAQDLLRCFNLGSDDFIPKPFEFNELTARIRAILRRVAGAPREAAEPRFQLDDLTLDPETYEVTVRGSVVRLTPTEFRILYLLATNAGHVVPSSRIYTYVWGSEGGDANALRSHISHLRHKLELLDSGQGTITSVPAVGYVMRRSASPLAAAAGGLVEAEASAAS
jgi:two-component system KDP operon response regulator KdpE